ncbi:MAG: FAD-binding oxidoreductase [bacterium]
MTHIGIITTDIARDYPGHLRDESRLIGRADSISFPRYESDVCATLEQISKSHTPVTTQGARTGITGGAVPRGGHILSLGSMNRITGMRLDARTKRFHLIVQPGVLLSQLRQAVASKTFDTADWTPDSLRALDAFQSSGQWFFPPDPTEASAAIGGMVAANASGARSFAYGPTRHYVTRLRIAMADGEMLELVRGARRTTGRSFRIPTSRGRSIEGVVPSYKMPAGKNASGYFASDNMDIIDMFIGSEGTLGVFTEIELLLLPAPAAVWAVMAFFDDGDNAVRFVRAVRESGLRPAAIEFHDEHSLALLRTHLAASPAGSRLPTPPPGRHTAIYVEYHGESESTVSDAVERLGTAARACCGSEEATWMATEPAELERLKAFRHAIPEAVNMVIDMRRKADPAITKLGTDMAVPDRELENLLAMYHKGLDSGGFEYVMFGHIGNNHLHVNILPRTQAEYDSGKALCLEWARHVIAAGGTVSAEHGIGKLKATLLAEMYGKQGIAEMLALKHAFDPAGLLNQGTLF